MKTLIAACLFISVSTLWGVFPTAYQGRFHPHDVYTKLAFYEFYHNHEIKDVHKRHFQDKPREQIIWELHRYGIASLNQAPLIYIRSAELKRLLNFNVEKSRFSFKQVYDALYQNRSTAQKIASILIGAHFSNLKSDRLTELTALSRGLWVQPDGQRITIIEIPDSPPWKFLRKGDTVNHLLDKPILDEVQKLIEHIEFLGSLDRMPDKKLSPQDQLARIGHDFKALPLKAKPGEWVSLRALKLDLPNFTPYPDSTYHQLQKAYLENDTKKLFHLLSKSYPQIAGTAYLTVNSKTLYYPSVRQLKAESLLFRHPWILICIALYAAALVCMSLRAPRLSLLLCLGAFIIHTGILAIRCYVLERPPVSNMFETVIYVPWIAMLVGLILHILTKERWLFFSACLINVLLLILLEVTQLSGRLDNVQAVLDSQYFLIIHVLMVVGSYGLFLLAGVMGHIYLAGSALNKEGSATMNSLARQILQAIYLGTALLIPGTVLGGVWAAESWGRFWDWDPKESWAFISACVYIIWIHAFRFGHIRDFGLAIGAVTGLLSISFTWYGVNYILGTGLHSYGFGSGGEIYYYAYLVFELCFVISVLYMHYQRQTETG